MICEMCNYAGEPAEFVEVFGGLVVCADFGGCINRQQRRSHMIMS